MYKIFVDSDCDFTPEDCERYGVDLISMPYEINEETVYPYETWKEFDSFGFYSMLEAGKMGTTFAITIEKYIEYFEKYLSQGMDIVYLHFSREMSSTFVQMDKAIEILREKYPNQKIMLVDTKAISLGSRAIIEEALILAQKGATAEEVVNFVENEKEHFAAYYFVDDLKHFRRSGRVSGVAAFVGGIVGIKPIITMQSDGKMSICAKIKGRVSAMNRLIKYMEDLGDEIQNHKVYLVYAKAPSDADELKKLIVDRFGDKLDFEINPLNPTAGLHCGPHFCGVGFHSKSR